MRALAAILVAVLLCSCSGWGEKREIRRVIARYNELVSAGYRSLDMNPLQEVTTAEQATKLYYHMSALGEGKLRMESDLKALSFEKIEVQEDSAMAQTRETWDFVHVDMKTGQKRYEERGFVYDMAYVLRKQGGRWVIVEVNTIAGKGGATVIPWPGRSGLGQ